MSHRLVTEETLRGLQPGSILRVPATAIVTPAARDRAALQGIRIERQEPAPASAPGLRDGDRVDLLDGDYLLEVRGGRVRLRRIDP